MSAHWAANAWKRSTWRTEWPEEFPVLVSTVKPQVSLRCGPWNAHEECRSPLCGCKCHEVPDAKRQG